MVALTDRQMDVYCFIADRLSQDGYPPTVREIGEAFEISSPNGVIAHLKALEKNGAITRQTNRARGIRLTTERGQRCPCCGKKI